MISIDALRADRLGCYGHAVARTPAIDALAARGVLFEETIAAATWTQPSVAAMLTGRWPARLSASQQGETTQSLALSETTLAEIFREAGYATGAFVDNGTLADGFGYDQGFETYFNVLADDGEAIARPAMEWIASKKDSPFFAWVHFLDPHAPYNRRDYPPYAPADDPRRGQVDRLDLPYQVTQSVLLRLAEHYDSEVAFADQCVGLLLAELDRLDLRDRTLVVLTADHGESLGEVNGDQRSFGHGGKPFEEQIRIPLVFSWPGRLGEGTRIPGQRSNVDILPTVLDLAGLRAPKDLSGTSLVPALRGKPMPPEDHVFSQSFQRPHDPEFTMRFAIRTPQVKLFAGPNAIAAEHFLRPAGATDFAAARRSDIPGEEYARLAGLLKEYVLLWASGPTNPSPEVTERLRAMGYLGLDRGNP